MGKKISFFLFTILANFPIAYTQEPFIFQNAAVTPGTKQHLEIPVDVDKDSTVIPITIFHGSKPGPVLGITAGVHGYEYPPILAAQELNKKIDPMQLAGTIVLVQMANVPSFLGRSPYLNPMDDKNLNRSFPGDADGSITERIAHTITNEIIAKSDFFVDMHAGDAPEDLMAYNACYQSEALPEVSQKGKEMALAWTLITPLFLIFPKSGLKNQACIAHKKHFIVKFHR